MFVRKFIRLHKKSFTLVEILVAIGIASILITIAVPWLKNFFDSYKFIEASNNIEYNVRLARMTAMERSVNVGLCVSSSTLQIVNMDKNRSGTCTGTTLYNISSNGFTLSGSGSAFDPRGLAIFDGYVCLAGSGRYYKLCISTARIRIDQGTGGCSSCSG